MSNAVQPLFNGATGTVTAQATTITLAALASSAAGVGRVSTQLDFQTSRPRNLIVFLKVTLGTSPVAGTVTLWLVRDDGSGNRTDAAGATDAALTVLNATPVLTLSTKATPATNDVLQGDDVVENPGPKCSFAVTHNTGVNLLSGQITYDYEYPLIA